MRDIFADIIDISIEFIPWNHWYDYIDYINMFK